MNRNYAQSTAARLACARTGVSYQKSLAAVRAGDLSSLLIDPYIAHELTELVASPLVAAGLAVSLREAKAELAASTLAALARRADLDLVEIVVEVDEEEPLTAAVRAATDASGQELGSWDLPDELTDASFAWANVFAGARGLDAGEFAAIQVRQQ